MLRRWVLAANLAAALLSVGLIAAVPTGDRVIVFVSPWSAEGTVIETISRANGSVVNGGRTGWIAVATDEKDGFAGRLYNAGAILVLNGELAAGCFQR
ncbi:MAG: hypothetical protein KDJ63_05975 [Nitratireductor sp.]|nr:hypothetical protein [Nitratireductor sp.]